MEFETPGATRTMTADVKLPSTLAREYTLHSLTGGKVPFWLLGAVIVAAAAICVFATLNGDLIIAGLLGALVILWLLIAALQYQMAKRGVALAYPPGSVFSVTVGETALRSTSALGTQELSYAAVRRVIATPHTVIIQLRAGQVRLLLPRAVLGAGDLELFMKRVAAAAPR